MRARRGLSALLLGGLVGALLVALPTAFAAPKTCDDPAGDYIVTFKGNSAVSEELKKSPGNAIKTKAEFSSVLKGFAATLTSEQVCDFKKRGNIEFVEADGFVTTSAVQKNVSKLLKEKPFHTEGYDVAEWVLIDYIDEKLQSADHSVLPFDSVRACLNPITACGLMPSLSVHLSPA